MCNRHSPQWYGWFMLCKGKSTGSHIKSAGVLKIFNSVIARTRAFFSALNLGSSPEQNSPAIGYGSNVGYRWTTQFWLVNHSQLLPVKSPYGRRYFHSPNVATLFQLVAVLSYFRLSNYHVWWLDYHVCCVYTPKSTDCFNGNSTGNYSFGTEVQGKFNEISVDQPRESICDAIPITSNIIHNVAYTYLVAYATIYHPICPTH